jgi:hypothetical protein
VAERPRYYGWPRQFDNGVTLRVAAHGSPESHFRTLKYRPGFPERFGSMQDARTFSQEFFAWYNEEHRHSGLGLLSPCCGPLWFGARVSRKYDKPATPCERLLCCETVPEARKQELRWTFASLDPVLLLSRIRAAQRRISELEIGTTQAVSSPDDQKLDRFVDGMKLA